MSKISLPTRDLADFCKVSDKFLSKHGTLELVSDGNELLFHAHALGRVVQVSFPALGILPFNVIVDYTRFLNAVKNFHAEETSFNFGEKALVVKNQNTKVKYPYAAGTGAQRLSGFINYGVGDNFFTSLKNMTAVDDDAHKFKGVLLNTTAAGADLCKFNGQCLRVARFPGIDDLGRMILSGGLAKAASYPSNFKSLVYSGKFVGFVFGSDIHVLHAHLDDTYPEDYESFVTVPEGINTYSFDPDELFTAISSISSIMGGEELFINFHLEGQDPDTSEYVWVLSSKAYNGLQAEERVYSKCNLVSNPADWKVNKKQFSKVIKGYTDLVYIQDATTSYVVVSEGPENRDLAVFSKVG